MNSCSCGIYSTKLHQNTYLFSILDSSEGDQTTQLTSVLSLHSNGLLNKVFRESFASFIRVTLQISYNAVSEFR